MTLLTSMLERPLDPGYEEAARRRREAGLPAATSTRTIIVIVLAVLTGFLFAVSAQALRPKPTAAAKVRAELVQRIEAVQAQSGAQEAQVSVLSKEVQQYEALALQQSGRGSLTDEVKKLEVLSGATPLSGPGLTLTLDDASAASGEGDGGVRPDSSFESGRVTSADMQIVVNGLWGAGAEAISVNGHRLTSTAAIRFAGQAIIVDFRPLSRPYVITALGDPDGMQRIFEQSFGGVYLSQLTSEFGIASTLARSKNLSVPGDSSVRVSVAKPIQSGIGSSPSEPGATGSDAP
jgi:uncharacterized protein YlxW (UPF0749 family)